MKRIIIFLSMKEKYIHTLYVSRVSNDANSYIRVTKHREKYASSSRWSVRCLVLDSRRDDTVHSYVVSRKEETKRVHGSFLWRKREIFHRRDGTGNHYTRTTNMRNKTCYACRPDKCHPSLKLRLVYDISDASKR